jgi:hypothetical protein
MADKPAAKKRLHKATYSTDKKNGGYLVRVAGPTPNAFVGREIPVSTRDGAEHLEKMEKIVWVGKDKETAEPVCLYKFVSKPKEKVDAEF